MIWPLLSIFSLFPLVLKQAVYCVCSVEQPALKALCVCVFVPASLSDCVNPLEALVTSSLPRPLFFSTPASIGSFFFSSSWYAFLPASHCLVASLQANHKEGNPLLTSQDQTAIRNQWLWVLCTTCYQLPWCFAADQCLSRGIRGGKTRREVSVLLPAVEPIVFSIYQPTSEGNGSKLWKRNIGFGCMIDKYLY